MIDLLEMPEAENKLLLLASVTLKPEQEYEQFRDHNAENSIRKKRNKVGWRIDGRKCWNDSWQKKIFL